MVMLLAGKWKY